MSLVRLVRFMNVETTEQLCDYAASLPIAREVDRGAVAMWVSALATVSPPELRYTNELITLGSRGGGIRRSPGTILLNWRRFFDVGPDVAVAVAGLEGHTPFVRALLGLYVWNKVWRGSETPLGDAEASTIEAVWQHGGRSRLVENDVAFRLTNELRKQRGASALSREDFEVALDVLSEMGCVSLEEDSVRLVEWVRKVT